MVNPLAIACRLNVRISGFNCLCVDVANGIDVVDLLSFDLCDACLFKLFIFNCGIGLHDIMFRIDINLQDRSF